MRKYQYLVFYTCGTSRVWSFHGVYNKTEALGTASLCLNAGYEVRVERREVLYK